MRAFFANGVDKLYLAWVVEALPALVHLSLFIFFAGLVIYPFNIDYTVFRAVASWMGLMSGVYLCITMMPNFRYDSPYYSPLSSTGWFLCVVMLELSRFVLIIVYIFLNIAAPHFAPRFESLANGFIMWFKCGVEVEAEETASKGSPEVDGRIVEWTIVALRDDDAIEGFAEAIPGFYKSSLIKDPRQHLLG